MDVISAYGVKDGWKRENTVFCNRERFYFSLYEFILNKNEVGTGTNYSFFTN